MTDVVVVTGPGSIGLAIARRIGAGIHVVLADMHQGNADRTAEVMRNAGFDVSTTAVDISSRDSVLALVETATTHGEVTGLVHAAGVSPSKAPVEAILAVDDQPRDHHHPLASDELTGPRGEGYRRMLDTEPRRARRNPRRGRNGRRTAHGARRRIDHRQ
jgi:NAD(P)-dependent dehydrogenase (short-subunit alcohol dehydrogenase family)